VQKLQERRLINLFLADYVTETLQHNFLLQKNCCTVSSDLLASLCTTVSAFLL